MQGLWDILTNPEWLRAQQHAVLAWQAASPFSFAIGFFALFTALSALALPGCGVLALAAGMCFGRLGGTGMVVLASSVGASIAFMVARHFLRGFVQRRFATRMSAIEQGVQRDGALYLFSLRLVPLVPYALLNPLMGLTHMRLRTFFAVSVAGMLLGSAAYVQVGAELSRWGAGGSLWSAPLIAALLFIALLPWLARWFFARRKFSS